MATILVVDDHPTNREFFTTLLSYQGHRLLEAADGAEALALARAGRPDLIISDILMPTMDGFELVRHLRTDLSLGSTRVIFSTAHFQVLIRYHFDYELAQI
jgi:CheY-like chemotaxis protein